MGVNGWLRLGRVRKSPQVSVLRSFKNNGLGLQVRRGCPAGQRPRSRMRLWCVVRVFVRPPLLMDASRVREREAEEVFDLSERQDHRVRVSILQVLIQRLIFARHQLVPPNATFPPWRYVRRIAFMSTSATRHQNIRLEFETVKSRRESG